jgi:hypothetical protein
MSYQKRALITVSSLFLLALGAIVQCRADSIGIEATSAVSAAQKKTFLCAWHLSPCNAAVRSPQITVHPALLQDSNEDDSSHLAFDTSVAKVIEQTSHKPASGGGVNFIVASTAAGNTTHQESLALNMMLDRHYHGDIFNSIDPFDAMQFSLNYTHAW